MTLHEGWWGLVLIGFGIAKVLDLVIVCWKLVMKGK